MLKLRTDTTYVGPTGKMTQAGVEAIQGQIDETNSGLGARLSAVEAELAGSLVNLQTAVSAAAQTSIDFTGIPAWVNRLTLTASDLSTNGTSVVIVQIGDSGGVETTGYIGGVFTIVNTGTAAIVNLGSGFSFSFAAGDTAASVRHFSITISRHSGNTWFGSGSGTLSNTQYFCSVTGTKALSSVLDRIRVTTAGGVNTFDAGSVNLSWE